jgi:glycosyltransferase involved in cell wall biosynthesis
VVVLDARVVRGAGGGPEKTILGSPGFLADSGYRMLSAYLHAPDDPGFEQIRERARAKGAPLYSVPDRGPWDWRVVTHLLEICKHEQVAIWHGHDYKSNLLGLMLCRCWPMRLVTTVHGWVERNRRTALYFAIDKLCLPRYDRVFCVSDDLRMACLAAGVSPERCRLLENGIDTGEFTRTLSTREAKQRLGYDPERPLIGAVGRLSDEKGFDVLLRAAAAGFDSDVVIAGEGPLRPALESLIAELGLSSRVRLLGFRSDTISLYQALDVFVLSSRREGLPNVVLEAMAMGVPVVATRVGGLLELVEPGRNGLLVEPDSVADLARAVERLLADSAQRSHLATEARRTIESRFSFQKRMDAIRHVYDEMI